MRGCGCKERSWVLLLLYCPKSSVEVPCVGVLCGQASGLEILLCEGGDVELGARTSKHILLFALDPFALTLSLYIVPCINSYCSFIFICLACLSVHLLLIATSFLNSALSSLD